MNRTILAITVMMGVVYLTSCVATTGLGALGTLSSVQNDRRSVGVVVDDETLSLFLNNWAYDNPKLKGANINFLVYNKTVLITGEAQSESSREEIEAAIKKQREDIALVYNEIAVIPNSKFINRLKDTQIRLLIELLFQDQDVFYPGHVLVRVERGIVYLLGAVTKREAAKAVKISGRAKGVVKIIKVFEYLENIPKFEVIRNKKRQEETDKLVSINKKRQELEVEKKTLQKEINKLESLDKTEIK